MLKKNIFFILIVITLLSAIAIFNYKMNPFSYNSIPQRLSVYQYPYKRLNILLKMSKKKQYDLVVMGGSTEHCLYKNALQDKKFAIITVPQPYISEICESLNNFITIHPETNTIIFSLPFFLLLQRERMRVSVDKFPKWTGKELCIEEYIYMLFSYDAIEKSIRKWKKIPEEDDLRRNPALPMCKKDYSHSISLRPLTNMLYQNFRQEETENLQESIKAFRDKGIKVICIIPPLHTSAIGQQYLYNKESYKKVMNYYKSIVTDKIFDKVYSIYDTQEFAKYPLNNNYLYYDLLHPTFHWGVVIDDIFSGKNEYKDMYTELTEKNIDKYIKEESLQLEDYVTHNKDYLEYIQTFEESHDSTVNYFEAPKNIKDFADKTNFKIFS